MSLAQVDSARGMRSAYIPFVVLPHKVQIYILRHLPIFTAAAVSQASAECYRAFKRFLKAMVFEGFDAFDLPGKETLLFMKSAKAIASGSAVLRILDPKMGRPGDLDLYLPNGNMDLAHDFLVKYNYTLVQSYPDGWRVAGRREAGIREVRYYSSNASGRLVNVIETTLSSSPTAVFLFHSTVVMNYISWNAIVSAYPVLTFRNLGLLNSDRLEEPARIVACLEKYRRRGYRFLESSLEHEGFPAVHMCGEFEYCGHTVRQIGDGAVMRLSFSGDPLELPDVVDSDLKWLLSCRRGHCGNPSFSAYAGWVESGDGVRLGHTSYTFSSYLYPSNLPGRIAM